jgi:hypothetical protein
MREFKYVSRKEAAPHKENLISLMKRCILYWLKCTFFFCKSIIYYEEDHNEKNFSFMCNNSFFVIFMQ